MPSPGAAPRAAVTAGSARAQASRINGARSRGPRTAEGKARSSQNALRHGLRAQTLVLLPDEDAAEFHALEAALVEELAPDGVLQSILAERVARAAWRLARADRIEGELFEHHGSRDADGDLAMALIRDGHGPRTVHTLLRYRGAAMAEFWRALHTLKALQAEEVAPPPLGGAGLEPAPMPLLEPAHESARSTDEPGARENPIEPEPRTNPGESEPERGANEPEPEARTPPGVGRDPEFEVHASAGERRVAPHLFRSGRGRPGSTAPRC